MMKKSFFALLVISLLVITGCASSPRAVSRVTELGIGMNNVQLSGLFDEADSLPLVENVYPNLEQKPYPTAIAPASNSTQVNEKQKQEAIPLVKTLPRETSTVSELVTFPTQGRAKELASDKLPYQLREGQSLVSYPIKSDEDFIRIIQALLHSPAQPVLLVGYNNNSSEKLRAFRRELGQAGVENNFFLVTNVHSTNGGLGELVCIK